jgi:ABC-type transport system involved in multi-copper enzyme maturation permease subunit
MITQTAALFLDAYRELNAKKMFWISLAISGIVVAAFAAVGINARGFTVLWFEFQSVFNTTIIPQAVFYKILFSTLGVSWWLNWIGIILALVSTAGIVPDFIAGGSVDLYLSKPISRTRLFLTKYLTGLLFVTLQVAIFSAASYVMIGIRAHMWDVRVFLAIPVVVLVYSYLFAVCALLGLLTRSTVATLLLTVLFWFAIFGIDAAASILQSATIAGQMETEAYQNQFAYNDKQVALYTQRVADGDAAAQKELDTARARRRELEEKKQKTDPTRKNLSTAFRVLDGVQALLPKTGRTNALLERWLDVDESRLQEERIQQRDRRRAANGFFSNFRGDRTEVRLDDADVIREAQARNANRPAAGIIGSSLAFEAVILGLATWLFSRRDY